MREYKFRGKDIETGEWIYGNLCKNIKGDYGIQIEQGEFKWKFVKTVYIESIGQYTGFKDKNGVEIYEGDIVKICEKLSGKIEFDEEISAFILRYINYNKYKYLGKWITHYEVIGGIY